MSGIYTYQYPGYDPTRWTTYKVDWRRNSIAWSIEGRKRVMFKRLPEGDFVAGPLPIRYGIWATPPERSWAGGYVNWRPDPYVVYRNLRVEGCRKDA